MATEARVDLDEIGGPDDSPDVQLHPDPVAPKGLKRINKVPLVIIGGIVVAVVIAITYTMQLKQAEAVVKQSAPAVPATLDEAAAAPVSAGLASAADGYIAPDMPVDPSPAGGPPTPMEIPVGAMPSDGSGSGTAGLVSSVPEPSPEKQFAMQWRMARLEKIKEIEEAKFEAQRAALQGESSGSGRKAEQAGAGGLDPATAAALSGLAGIDTTGMDPGTAARIADLQRMGAAMGGAGGDANRQAQADKRAFLAQEGAAETYLKATREAPVTPYELKAGSLIPALLISGINSDLPGQVIGQVRENVYDSASGRFLLIPQGSRLIGTYDTGVSFGQNRVLAGWTRVIYPDGSSLNLGLMPGSDRAGYAGFADKTNNHYLSTFGSAFMIAAFTGGVQLSQPRSTGPAGTYDSQQILAGELGRQLGQVGAEYAKRNLDRSATVEIRPGYKFNVMVSKDIILPPYRGR